MIQITFKKHAYVQMCIKGNLPYTQTCSLNYTNNYQYNMCLRAYASIFFDMPQKTSPNSSTCITQGAFRIRCLSTWPGIENVGGKPP